MFTIYSVLYFESVFFFQIGKVQHFFIADVDHK